ncbi:MAG: hypothetical protein Udaeo2_08200 [Candidatus Udaeobacter sp.]|nr:MAG: hypothetical protein Udaeo2_08200 [Candidatus Udaeobacter sp.]
MKTSLLFGATLAVVGAAIVSISGQTQRASPATTATPCATPGRASPSPSAIATARPYATASPTTPGTATPSSSTRGKGGVTGRPEITPSPSGGAELEGESPPTTTRESPPKAATPAGTTKPTPSRPHRKLERREANTPPEGPRGTEINESNLRPNLQQSLSWFRRFLLQLCLREDISHRSARPRRRGELFRTQTEMPRAYSCDRRYIPGARTPAHRPTRG